MLDLKKLLDGSLSSVSFSVDVDNCDFVDETVSGSAFAKGEVTNHSGVILLEGEIKVNLKVSCARCGVEFDYNEPLSLTAKITDKLANEDEEEFILMTDSAIDVDELVRSSLILELPSKFLCRENCKGLCPKCGKNLNEGSCSCDTTDRDPRWDVLKDFFGD